MIPDLPWTSHLELHLLRLQLSSFHFDEYDEFLLLIVVF